METGSIQVRVFTSRGKIPVADATVVFLQAEEKDKIIALEVSNRSGMTRVIGISTPNLDESREISEGIGFSLIDVWVEHPEFVSQKLKDVQIFPQRESILPVELIPLSENESSLLDFQQTIFSEQNL